jgi:hypothetical protein
MFMVGCFLEKKEKIVEQALVEKVFFLRRLGKELPLELLKFWIFLLPVSIFFLRSFGV